MNAIDIRSMQISFRDRIPRTAQQLRNRIANRLSKKPKTIGSAYMNDEPDVIQLHTDDAVYTLGKNYVEAERSSIKPYGKKGQRKAHMSR